MAVTLIQPDPLPRIGAGVVLRRLRVDDLGAFQAYRSNVELARYQGWTPMFDFDAYMFLQEMSTARLFTEGKWVQLGLSRTAAGELVGDVGVCLSGDATHAEIGFTLAPHAQRQGLATSAVGEAIRLVFDLTPARRVLAITDTRNERSIRLLDRVGLRRHETRDAVFRGEPCVEHVYEMVRGGVAATAGWEHAISI